MRAGQPAGAQPHALSVLLCCQQRLPTHLLTQAHSLNSFVYQLTFIYVTLSPLLLLTAHREEGYEVVEVNASDARGKSDNKASSGIAGAWVDAHGGCARGPGLVVLRCACIMWCCCKQW
jgi:hypothetical protein